MKITDKPKFFINFENKSKVIDILKKNFPEQIKTKINKADKICKHIFNLFGSGEIDLGEKIDWHSDFKTGYRWNPTKHHKDIEIPYGRADIKIPWELSRFQHLAILGEAYWITKNEKYPREFINQVTDWINSNESGFGVNWRCTMDVAIRASNWILGHHFLKDSPEINDEFLKIFFRSLQHHGKHIMANLENTEKSIISNHYLSNIAGLVYLSTMFPEFKEWKDFCIKELIVEMERQVYPDGSDFEASTCYHCLVLELFFFSSVAIIVNDDRFNGKNYREISKKIFGKDYTNRLYKMFEVVLYVLKPNGKMPQIGDNDNGRYHVLAKRSVLDKNYFLALGAIFFDESLFKIKEFGFCEESAWIYGEKGYMIWKDLDENSIENIKSKAFPDAGWYILRNNQDYCFISCGPNGQDGNGGHAHNDKLSYELMIDGKEIVIDPGTFAYTSSPEWRDIFRNTASHNTINIEGTEQNELNKLFGMKQDTKCEVLKFTEDTFEGVCKRKDTFHKRTIIFKNKKLFVNDEIKTDRKWHNNIVFHPNINLTELDIIPSQPSELIECHYSPEYGIKEKTKKMKLFQNSYTINLSKETL